MHGTEDAHSIAVTVAAIFFYRFLPKNGMSSPGFLQNQLIHT
jgi:hypothetical protein